MEAIQQQKDEQQQQQLVKLRIDLARRETRINN